LQVKLCDPRLSALSVVATIKALYKYILSFPFPCVLAHERPRETKVIVLFDSLA